MDARPAKTARLLRGVLIYSVVTTAALAALSLLATRAASFLGKDVSSIAAGVVGFYPWVAVSEVARVLGVALLVSACGGAVAAGAAALLPERWRWTRWWPVVPTAAYGCWWLGTVLKYPALFESVLPDLAEVVVVRSAGVLPPLALFGAAGALGLMPLVLLAVHRPKQVSALAGAGALIWLALGSDFFAHSVDGAGSMAPAKYDGSFPPNGPRGPNVLVIAIDSLRADRAVDARVMPHLQGLLADEQTVAFNDHFVGIPRTFPSWIEILQGKQAPRTGIRHMFPGFAERSEPFAGFGTAFRAAGYATYALSDFAGDIFPRFESGFAEVVAPKLTLMTMIRLSVDQAFTSFLPFMTTSPLRHWFPALKQSPVFADPAHLGQEVSARAQHLGGRPWLITAFFSTAHFPYAAPYPFYSRFASPDYHGAFRFQKNPETTPTDLGNDEKAQVRALYDGALGAVDVAVGRILADLKARGLWDQTVVLVTADHGEDLYEDGNLQGHGEHLRGDHVLKVPFILKLAKGMKPQRAAENVTTRSIDIAPTLVAAAGLAQRVGDGTNLVPYVTGKAALPEQTAYAETGIWFSRSGAGFFQQQRLDYPGIAGLLNFDQGNSGEIVLNPRFERLIVAAKHRLLIRGAYKLIYAPTPRGIVYELYDRRRDPANQHNILAAEPEVAAAMRRELLATVQALEGNQADLLDDFVVPR